MAGRPSKKYKIIGKLLEGKEIKAYRVVDNTGKQYNLDKGAVCWLLGRGQVVDIKAQIYKGRLIMQGTKVSLNDIPSYQIGGKKRSAQENEQRAAEIRGKNNKREVVKNEQMELWNMSDEELTKWFQDNCMAMFANLNAGFEHVFRHGGYMGPLKVNNRQRLTFGGMTFHTEDENCRVEIRLVKDISKKTISIWGRAIGGSDEEMYGWERTYKDRRTLWTAMVKCAGYLCLWGYVDSGVGRKARNTAESREEKLVDINTYE